MYAGIWDDQKHGRLAQMEGLMIVTPDSLRSRLCGALLLCGLFSAAIPAQGQPSASLSISSGAGGPGSLITLAVTLHNSGGALPSSVQWNMSYAASLVSLQATVVRGAASTAEKSLLCVSNAGNGTASCLLYGLNQTTIGSGLVAEVQFLIAPTALPAQTNVTFSGMVVSDSTANSIPVSPSTAAGSILINATAPLLTSLSCSPGDFVTPGSASCQVGLSGPAPADGAVVSLRTGSGSLLIPPSVTIGAGSTGAGFSATAPSLISDETASITAQLGLASVEFVLNLRKTPVPTLSITAPSATGAFTTVVPSVAVAGTAAAGESRTLTQVLWANDRGGSGIAAGTASWSIPPVGLQLGQNRITVTATDSAGQTGSAQLVITRNPLPLVSSRVGVFRTGTFYLDSGNFQWDIGGTDLTSGFGQEGDIPIVGDWDGDGIQSIGVFRRGEWLLDWNSNGVYDGPSVDRQGYFGPADGAPLIGDWNADGRDEVGIFKAGVWLLDFDGNLKLETGIDQTGLFGQTGDTPLVGKWEQPGRSGIGIFRDGVWILDLNGNLRWDGGIDRSGVFGGAGDSPLVGDWTGDGKDKIGIYRSGLWVLDDNANLVWDASSDKSGILGGGVEDVPVVGDWSGTGMSRIGVFRKGAWILDRDGDLDWNAAGDIFGLFGQGTDSPLLTKMPLL